MLGDKGQELKKKPGPRILPALKYINLKVKKFLGNEMFVALTPQKHYFSALLEEAFQ